MPAVAPIPANAGIGLEATAGALKAFTCTLAVQGEGVVGGRIGVMVDMVSTSNTIARIPLAGHKGGATAPDTNGNRAVGCCIHSCFSLFYTLKGNTNSVVLPRALPTQKFDLILKIILCLCILFIKTYHQHHASILTRKKETTRVHATSIQ